MQLKREDLPDVVNHAIESGGDVQQAVLEAAKMGESIKALKKMFAEVPDATRILLSEVASFSNSIVQRENLLELVGEEDIPEKFVLSHIASELQHQNSFKTGTSIVFD